MNKALKISSPLILFIFLVPFNIVAQENDNQRLIVLADMGNETDEEQQLVHLLLSCNEFDLEGLIAVTGKYLRPESKNEYKQKLHPELFLKVINGYKNVWNKLLLHDNKYPSPEYLKSIVRTGQEGYGIAATGKGLATEGSRLIID
ncbi:MAG: nucleoside hydrolase-like domain-containing protein, partial [Bacteroidota bacterium]